MEADIGIIGGSGFYSLLANAEQVEVNTKYGKPSDKISFGTIDGKKIAFLPRHGYNHTIPPHKVPYRANIEAMANLGVTRIIATGASGSLTYKLRIGQIVFFDQFINMTSGRADTFFDENEVAHVTMADPYCPELRAMASGVSTGLGFDHRDQASVVVINGPRFSTKAESLAFANQGFDMVNMTQYPEVALAKEKGICYLGIGVVTDYDAGMVGNGSVEPVTHVDVADIFGKNIEKVKAVVNQLVKDLPMERRCSCKDALKGAIVKV